MNYSQQKAYLTGANGKYTTDTVKGISELADTNGFNGSMSSGYVGTYNMAYRGGMMGHMLMGKPDYTNKDDILHNNVGENILLEQIIDNKLFIDTSIRDYSKSSNPFKFVVKFNGIEAKTTDIGILIDGTDSYTYKKYIKGDTDVVMDRVFKNIKMVQINNLIMPNYIDYTSNSDGSYSKVGGGTLAKSKYKYLILKISELSNNRCFSNNKAFGKECFFMKMDDEICCFNHRWIPSGNATTVYPDSNLQTINRLTIEICDDKGNVLNTTLDGEKYDFFKEYNELLDTIKLVINPSYDKTDPFYVGNTQIPPSRRNRYQNDTSDNTRDENKNLIDSILSGDYSDSLTTNVINRLESLRNIIDHMSPELHLTFSIIGPQIDTMANYGR
jgi:hypothetical protein